ncbi:MAG: hypothetical protein FD180_3261 [Planctomycetota bacterium]|nr:MAG: hypothetical protein FD180_3261 [Planctomycetota bacterium]
MNLFSRIVTIPFFFAASFCFAGDDIDFARGLARDGFVQQAEDMCRKIEAGADAQEKAAVPLVRAEIAMKRAASASTLSEAREELASGAAALDAFADANPGHPRFGEALMQAGLMRRQCGEVAEQEVVEDRAGAAKAAERGREELEKGLKNLEAAGASAKTRKQNIESGWRASLRRGKTRKISKRPKDRPRKLPTRPLGASTCADASRRMPQIARSGSIGRSAPSWTWSSTSAKPR